ncbi:MAG: dephospho-CoA kinase [Chitinophagaceae bacterium]|nr:MAG: dephospho-CoA kinase [Chitinophagaceae bacterium]
MALRIGLTGGIGSGKSTVARIFEVLGVPVYYADLAARELMNTDVHLREDIIAAFGNRSYANEKLDRAYIADIVFKDPQQLGVLNQLTHPATIRDANEWMQRQTALYTIKEAALIFESGSSAHLDYVIGVYTPYPLRLQRVLHRDNASREQVIARMDKQIDENIKMKLCDFVIYNDEAHPLIPQVLTLHERFLQPLAKTPIFIL